MAAETAVPMEGPDDEGPSGAFQDALRERRDAVLARLRALSNAPRLAELVFDLFAHLALNPEGGLDAELMGSFAARHDLELQEVAVPDAGGRLVGLMEILGAEHPPPGTIEATNALFAQGYAAKLGPLAIVERRDFTLRVVGMLPGVERLGPFVLSDFIDHVCDEEDALRFWQIYVDRVAAEVSKRTRQPAEGRGEPWLLSKLVRLHEQGPAPSRGGAWLTLKRHVNRVLQTGRHRWRFIRSLAEGCHDPRMLHYLCIAPAMVEDAEVIHVFLSRGNSKLVSCALFAMQVHSEVEDAVERLLQHFRDRPLPEIGDRLVDIYAQIHLLSAPAAPLRTLADGIRRLTRERVREGSVEALMTAVANDARALRQSLLLADVVEDGRADLTPQVRQLLERVVGTFFQSFTPSGVDHFLNDEVFRGGVRRALRALLGAEVTDVGERLEAFGLDLGGSVERWVSDGMDDVRQRLLHRYLGIYGYTVVGVCRALYNRAFTREAGLAAYRTLVRVYLKHASVVQGTGWFGALEYVLPPLFPDLLETEHGRTPDAALVSESALTVARVEQELWPYEDDPGEAPLVFPRRPASTHGGIPPPSRTSMRAEGALLANRPTRDRPLKAPVSVLRRGVGRLPAVLRAYLGLDLLSEGVRAVGRFLGLRNEGELVLTDREFMVTRYTTLNGRSWGRTADSQSLDDLTAVRVVQQMRAFYLVAGMGGLVTAGLVGGHLLFVGLRGAETGMAVVGVGLLALGLIFDTVMTRLAEENRKRVVLELRCRSRPQLLRLSLDAESGAEVLDAFMANDAERRELELLERWAATEVEWESVED